jgi:hypothetical protein
VEGTDLVVDAGIVVRDPMELKTPELVAVLAGNRRFRMPIGRNANDKFVNRPRLENPLDG